MISNSTIYLERPDTSFAVIASEVRPAKPYAFDPCLPGPTPFHEACLQSPEPSQFDKVVQEMDRRVALLGTLGLMDQLIMGAANLPGFAATACRSFLYVTEIVKACSYAQESGVKGVGVVREAALLLIFGLRGTDQLKKLVGSR